MSNLSLVRIKLSSAAAAVESTSRTYGQAQAHHIFTEANLKSAEADAARMEDGEIEKAGYPKGWGSNDAARKLNMTAYLKGYRESEVAARAAKVTAEAEYNAARAQMKEAQGLIVLEAIESGNQAALFVLTQAAA